MTLSPRATAWIFWGATVWLTLELALGGAMDLVRGRSIFFTGDPVDVVVSSLGYPVYVPLFLGIFKLLGAVVIRCARPRAAERVGLRRELLPDRTRCGIARDRRHRLHQSWLSDRCHAAHARLLGVASRRSSPRLEPIQSRN
jgi:hypothetical protein